MTTAKADLDGGASDDDIMAMHSVSQVGSDGEENQGVRKWASILIGKGVSSLSLR